MKVKKHTRSKRSMRRGMAKKSAVAKPRATAWKRFWKRYFTI